jgi:N utilization substance protein A
MGRVIYDQEIMGLIGVLGRLLRIRIKDLFKEEDVIYCIVEPGQIGKAIGKGGENIKKVNQVVKKKVKFVEFRNTAAGFVRNLIYPIRVEGIEEKEGVVEIVGGDRKTKGLLIGRDGRNLALLNKAVKRFFDVEVKVV